ncbi:MAG: dTMP kinase [Clostridiales bacterium]|nr:dTMP kinase [Clostridiales bacterium]
MQLESNGFNKSYSGKLIIVEGLDGSGKSTQLYLLKCWLVNQDIPVFFTEWNSSSLVKKSTKRAKKLNQLSPTTFSLIHASDFADRYEKTILPHLKAGYLVLADRYVYTAYARDIARGCDSEWVRNVYEFAVKPDLALYFEAPLEVSINRIISGRTELKYHEAGMDLNLSSDKVESFKLFQGIIKREYDNMAEDEDFVIIDATKQIEKQQKKLRKIVTKRILNNFSPPVCGKYNNNKMKEGHSDEASV